MDRGIVYKKLETDEEIAGAKKLIIEYAKWLNLDLCFQNIDDELNNFPEKYKEPDGAFIRRSRYGLIPRGLPRL